MTQLQNTRSEEKPTTSNRLEETLLRCKDRQCKFNLIPAGHALCGLKIVTIGNGGKCLLYELREENLPVTS